MVSTNDMQDWHVISNSPTMLSTSNYRSRLIEIVYQG